MLEELSPEDVSDLFDENKIILVDVRTALEFAMERIKGAINAPMATLDPVKLPNQDARKMVLMCGTGIRSAKVAQLCLQNGYQNVTHMKGGLNAWKLEGFDTVAVNPITGNMDV
ncbi:MAG: rhodanese-like domain-containing protein [bacterium]